LIAGHEVDVLPARLGDHAGDFGVGQREQDVADAEVGGCSGSGATAIGYAISPRVSASAVISESYPISLRARRYYILLLRHRACDLLKT
jgi:hypothetical protein